MLSRLRIAGCRSFSKVGGLVSLQQPGSSSGSWGIGTRCYNNYGKSYSNDRNDRNNQYDGKRYNNSRQNQSRNGYYSRNTQNGHQNRYQDRNGYKSNRRHGNSSSGKNSKSVVHPEGDGLLGETDYIVDRQALKSMKWEDLVDVAPEETKFSGISTLNLAENKVISRVLVNSLHHNRKYTELTPVQARSILPILSDKSMVVRAKTGTGKTAAFSVPLLEKVYQAQKNNIIGVKGLIIAPTRELAQQISDEINAITAYGELRKIKTVCLVGGMSRLTQERQAFGRTGPADVIVGTPGRLLDFLSEPELAKHFSGLAVKVLDEADRLLDIGFKETLLDIDQKIKRSHGGHFQTLLFSATTDKNMLDFADKELDGNVQIEDTVPEDEPQAQELVSQHSIACRNWAEVYYASSQAIVDESLKASEANTEFKAIVFLPTVALVQNFARTLERYRREVSPKSPWVFDLHGQLTQRRRQMVSDEFRACKSGILVTTDVVARGMDFPNVTHVFQMGTPGETAAYIHRIGRTARIGNRGKSYLIHIGQEAPYLKMLSKINVEMVSSSVFDHKSSTVIQPIAKIAPELPFEDRTAALKSMFAFYSNVQSLFRIVPTKFNRDQEQFASLLGFTDEQIDDAFAMYGMRDNARTRKSPRSWGSRGGFRGGGSQNGSRGNQGNRGRNNRGSKLFW